MVWSETHCMHVINTFEPCQPSDTRCSGSWLHTVNGNQEQQSEGSKDTCVASLHSRQSFAVAHMSFVFANSETETCWESCIHHFQTNVPFLFSLPQMKHLGMTIELDPKGDKITCPAFGLYSSPAEYSTVGHIGFGFDESCVTAKIA